MFLFREKEISLYLLCFLVLFCSERVHSASASGICGSVDDRAGARDVRAEPLPRGYGGQPARRRANTDHCTRKYPTKKYTTFFTVPINKKFAYYKRQNNSNKCKLVNEHIECYLMYINTQCLAFFYVLCNKLCAVCKCICTCIFGRVMSEYWPMMLVQFLNSCLFVRLSKTCYLLYIYVHK